MGGARDGSGSAEVRAAYRSGWFTVVLPTLEFLLLWPGLSVLVLALMGWRSPGWLAALVVVLALPASLAACVATYPLLLRLAGRGRGGLLLRGERIRWRAGRRWHQVDLTRPYRARVAAGASGRGAANASVSFAETGLIVHLRGAGRDEVLRDFPEPFFVDELAVTPEEGLWGFELDAHDPAGRALFGQLLEALWRSRDRNARFRTYSKFPWSRPAQPAFAHIEVVEADGDEAGRQLLARLEAEVVSRPSAWLALTPDYVVGSEAGLWDTFLGRQRSFIMPLGHVRAEETLPRPDLGPFLLGNFVVTALGGSPGTRVPLQDRYFLRIHGRDRAGAPLTVAFEWLGPADEGYEEGEFFVRFVNRAP